MMEAQTMKPLRIAWVLAACAMILLAASDAAHAEGGFEGFEQTYGNSFNTQLTQRWMPLCIIAIAIGVLFNALVYMVGNALQSEPTKRYASSELLQTAASSLLIFFAVALLYGITNSGLDFMGELIGNGSVISCAAYASNGGLYPIWADTEFGQGPLAAFKCKIQEKINALDNSYDTVFNSNKGREMLTSSCISLFGATVYCWDWDLSLHTQVEEAHLVASKMVGLLVSLHGQFVMAEYLQKNMLAVFLPMGLALRIFPLTRGVGGLFIAIAIGFFFIFPTFVLLTDPTFVKVDLPPDDKLAGKCFTGFKGTAVLLAALDYGATAPQDALATAQGADLVFQLTIAALFYPFVSLVLTLVFIRAATPILGGDTGELMRLVSRLG